MIYAIVRMYATAAEAAAALAKLESCGLSREENRLNLVTAASAASADGLVGAITAGLVLKAHARIYAQGILSGRALVSLHAPFGTGRIYEDMLDALNPVDSGVREEPRPPAWDDAAPFSSAFGWPVILQPSPYQFMGLPAILRSGATTSSWLGLGELADTDMAVFGAPTLSRNPAPFSAMLHLPVIKS